MVRLLARSGRKQQSCTRRKRSARLAALVSCLALALALAGCATREGYRQRLVNWVGAPADSLILSWGPPTREATLSDGRRVLQYDSVYTSYFPGTTTYSWDTVPVVTAEGGITHRFVSVPVYSPGHYYTWSCSTRFIVAENGRIQSFSFEGNGCRAVPKDG